MKIYVKNSNELRPIYPETLREALKFNFVKEIGLDLYQTEDGRTLLYDRYRPTSNPWVSSDGWAYRNFFECWQQSRNFAKYLKKNEILRYTDKYNIDFDKEI